MARDGGLLGLLATICLLLGSVVADDPQPASPAKQATVPQDKPGVPAEAKPLQSLQPWQVDVAASRVYVYVDKTGLGHVQGIEGRLKEGRLCLKDLPAQESKLVFDLTTFTASNAARAYLGISGKNEPAIDKQITANLQGASVLDSAKFPVADFVLRKIGPAHRTGDASRDEAEKGDRLTLHGELTLHGVKQNVTIAATRTDENGRIHLRGKFDLRQSDYGIKPLSLTFVAGVSDVLTVHGDLWIEPGR